MPTRLPPMPARRLASCALVAWAASAGAAEYGGTNYIPGFYGDFYMASLGKPGVYLNNLASYYHAGANGGSADVALELPGLVGVTDYRLLGGRYAWGAFPSGIYASLRADADAKAPRHFTEKGGLGDAYLIPLGLAWEGKDGWVLAYQGILAPIGSFGAHHDLNLSRNYWTFDSNVSATWLLGEGHYEVSANLGLMVNTQNPETDYRTGSELHFDYLLGYHPTPSTGLGVAGSYYAQVSGDSGRGVSGSGSWGEFATIGPAAMYCLHLSEGHDLALSVKWLHEFAVSNRPAGDYVLVRAVYGF